MRPPSWAFSIAFFGAAAGAAELTPADVAKVEREQRKAVQAVDKAHGNRKHSEMTSAERATVIHEQAEAAQAVLDKKGIDRKELAGRTAKLSREEQAQVKAETASLEAKDTRAPAPAELVPVEKGLPESERGVEGANEAAALDRNLKPDRPGKKASHGTRRKGTRTHGH